MTVSGVKMDQEGSPSPTVKRERRCEGASDRESCAGEDFVEPENLSTLSVRSSDEIYKQFVGRRQ